MGIQSAVASVDNPSKVCCSKEKEMCVADLRRQVFRLSLYYSSNSMCLSLFHDIEQEK